MFITRLQFFQYYLFRRFVTVVSVKLRKFLSETIHFLFIVYPMRIDIPDSRRMLRRGFAASPPFKLLHANFSRRCADSCILRPTRARAG